MYGRFITPARVRLATVVFAALVLCAAALFVVSMFGVGRPSGALPPALDFAAFWSAATLAVQGQLQGLYDNTIIEAFERQHVALPGPGYLAFYYPPPFLLLCLPLALLPYVWALLLFIAAQAALLWPVLRQILPDRWAVLPIMAYPGFLMNAFSGQNGGLTAACFAGGMAFLQTRPLLAGVCLGALVYKPQMALAVPVALLGARRFQAAAAAVATAATLCAVSFLALGGAPWRGFLANAGAARGDLEHLSGKWPMMSSFYADIRLLGGTPAIGYVAQFLLAGVALVVLARICWRRPGGAQEGAALATTALLVTPFLYDYDLVVLAGPLAWLAASCARTGARPSETMLLLVLYFLPLASVGVRYGALVAPAPAFVLCALLLIWRRLPRKTEPCP